jgi:hypothetical protein
VVWCGVVWCGVVFWCSGVLVFWCSGVLGCGGVVVVIWRRGAVVVIWRRGVVVVIWRRGAVVLGWRGRWLLFIRASVTSASGSVHSARSSHTSKVWS